ncbi:putative lipoprotein [Streptomyces mashuensis]|uniref:Lipoprotein n=1 Tax=Streptomyces mashuensis TaxID=33904 RepID=A0A919EB87_9ACTN|nr:hypothetical protein [Streptomyces mashuensis]GHF32689.1 putative lipoprotein [Streptomyces mashuensis]
MRRPPIRRSPRRTAGPRKAPRALRALFALPLLAAATGCVTVHGERAVIPALPEKAEAARVLRHFTDGYNEAYRKLDPALVDRVETGALAEIGRADLAAQRAVTPGGNPGYPPLVLDDARFTIPKMAGWPKFFVADTRSNRDRNRWVVVFTRDGAHAPWKAAYLSLLPDGKVPRFALDADGYARAVPVPGDEGPRPVAEPGALSAAYATYLRTGGGGLFAPGGATTELRDERAKLARTPTFWTEYADTAAKAPAFPVPALRAADGGTVAFFTAHHHEKRTMAQGMRPSVTEPRTKALLQGNLNRAVTYTRVSESAVLVPDTRGQVVFLSRIESLTAVKGE